MRMIDERIRSATASDAQACAAILGEWIDQTDWMPRTMSQAELVTALQNGLPKREAYVIGKPVQGYLSLEPEANHIWGFYIARRGQGLGKALLDHAKSGRTYLRLNSHKANKRAHGFYRREGFVQTGEPWVGGDGIEEIRMEWQR